MDRNTAPMSLSAAACSSPSTRRAWIEISPVQVGFGVLGLVALHPEGVDRNKKHTSVKSVFFTVALHPEGVDRNTPDLLAN